MTEIKLDNFYAYIFKLKQYLNTGKDQNWFFNVCFMRGRRDIRIQKILATFMSYFRSSHFSELDFQMYFLFKLLEDEDFLKDSKKWLACDVKNISLKDASEKLKSDQEFLIEVSKKTNFTSLEKFFDINMNGESLIYSFYMKGYISIHFLIEYNMFFKESDKQTKKHEHVVKIVKLMKKILKNYKEK